MFSRKILRELAYWSGKPDRKPLVFRGSKNSNAEVDYIVLNENRLIPIKVKSGDASWLRSLHLFMDGVSHETAVRFWSKPMQSDRIKTLKGKEFNLLSLPLYFAGLLQKIYKIGLRAKGAGSGL